VIDRREFLRRSGQATLGTAVLAALPSRTAKGREHRSEHSGGSFHVSWARIQPTGSGPGDVRELDVYSRLVDRLLEQRTEPVPTLFGSGLQRTVHETGGWTERATAERFADYAKIVADALGDRVQDWLLLEEPSVFLRSAYPAFGRYLHATHVANLAVGRGYRAIKAASTTARVGSVVRFNLFEGATGSAEDAAAADRCRRFERDWFLQPILMGAYPNAFLEHIPYDLMHIENADFDVARAPLDFVGLRVHTRRVVTYDPVRRDETGLFYAVRGDGRPALARDAHDAVSQLAGEYGVQTHLVQALSHDVQEGTV
jgi:beta-glucosidase